MAKQRCHHRWAILMVCAFALLLALPANDALTDEPKFPTPPRLAISAAEWKARRQSDKYAALRARAVRLAEAVIEKPVEVPAGPGDWTFYYACPDDGTTLRPRLAAEHVCPQCKKSFRDERTCAAYRTRLHDRANRAAEQLGWGYLYTGEERYAAEARRILCTLAEAYDDYPARRDRWVRRGWLAPLGGRRYSQSLDEAVGIIQLAKAYDLTRTAKAWSDEDRRLVEEQLFRPTAETLLYMNWGVNNHQTWYNAGLMAIASVLANEKLVNRVLAMKGGFRDQLARSIDEDGLWYEGAMAYQNYALQAMVEIVDAGRRMDLPLEREPKLRALLLAPANVCYPNGQFPAINDSDRLNIRGFDWSFAWAARTFDDWPGDPRPPIESRSMNLEGAGLAVLRRGKGVKAVCAMLDYGPHGGGHGHFDKLNLLLYANGRELLLDPGRLNYSHKEYRTWVKHTAAHNTVTLKSSSQLPTQGKIVWWDVRPEFVACTASCDGAYRGTQLMRYLCLHDTFLADVFTVETGEQSQIDWFAHVASRELAPAGGAVSSEPIELGKRSGYQHLAPSRRFQTGNDMRWDFIVGDGKRLRVWCPPAAGEQTISTTGIGYTVNAKVPCLLRRRLGKRAEFVTVYDLSEDGSHVRRVTTGDEESLLVEVETTDATWRLDFAEQEFTRK